VDEIVESYDNEIDESMGSLKRDLEEIFEKENEELFERFINVGEIGILLEGKVKEIEENRKTYKIIDRGQINYVELSHGGGRDRRNYHGKAGQCVERNAC